MRQILPNFLFPITICVLLSVGGLLRKRRWPIVASVALLWLSSAPLLSGPLMRAAEHWADRIPASAAPAADAIVVLSAGRVRAPGPGGISEWDDPDRFFGGLDLFKAHKAPVLVFTGAVTGPPPAPLEGQILAEYALGFGVPAERVLLTSRVTTTEDEARAVAVLLRERQIAPRILLVTSAFHMPRAQRLFEQQRITVFPFPVDFRHPSGSISVADLLPSAGAQAQTQTALRELYGRAFYLIKGS